MKGITAANIPYLHYDEINPNSCITKQHLLALVLYTDNDELCSAFTRTFRRKPYESISKMKERNQEYWNWSKLMREAVEIFGESGWKQNSWNIETKQHSQKDETDPTRFFRGMDTARSDTTGYALNKPQLVLEEFGIRLCGPTSTTRFKEVAMRFSGEDDGIIVTFSNDGYVHADLLPMIDCAWFSNKGKAESETLFMGGYLRIKIETVTKISAPTNNYKKYLKPLYYFHSMLNGTIMSDKQSCKPSEKYYNKLDKLIKYRLSSLETKEIVTQIPDPQYIYFSFAAFLEHQRHIIINLHQIHQYSGGLGELVIHSKSESDGNEKHNLFKEILYQLCPNVTCFTIYTSNQKENKQYVDYPINLHQVLESKHLSLQKYGRKGIKIIIKAIWKNDNEHSWICDALETDYSALCEKYDDYKLIMNNSTNTNVDGDKEDCLVIQEINN